jgi:hypothetical protein
VTLIILLLIRIIRTKAIKPMYGGGSGGGSLEISGEHAPSDVLPVLFFSGFKICE